jgi:calcineurin-like phosphoesterase family protein
MKPNEFISADLHLGHRLMAKERSFESIETMDAHIVNVWNSKIPAGAVVYMLGDVSFHKRDQTAELLQQLNGTWRIVRGNHDKKYTEALLVQRAEWVRDYYESKTEEGGKVCMSHYAMHTWNKAHYGAWMLHGHSHGSLQPTERRRLDVGIDAHPEQNYEPFSFQEIALLMERRIHVPVDHHVGH